MEKWWRMALSLTLSHAESVCWLVGLRARLTVRRICDFERLLLGLSAANGSGPRAQSEEKGRIADWQSRADRDAACQKRHLHESNRKNDNPASRLLHSVDAVIHSS